MEILRNKVVILRLFTVASCSVSLITGVINIFKPLAYSSQLLCVYLIVGSCIGIFTEISPLLMDKFVRVILPCMEDLQGRVLLYVVLATFCFGPEMG